MEKRDEERIVVGVDFGAEGGDETQIVIARRRPGGVITIEGVEACGAVDPGFACPFCGVRMEVEAEEVDVGVGVQKHTVGWACPWHGPLYPVCHGCGVMVREGAEHPGWCPDRPALKEGAAARAVCPECQGAGTSERAERFGVFRMNGAKVEHGVCPVCAGGKKG